MSTSVQKKIVQIGSEVFGVENLTNRTERLKRFFEEAVELARAGGLTADDIHAIVGFELGRKVGELHQELGGAGVTLYSLADSFGMDLEQCITTEIERVAANKEKCRAKHAAKPAIVKAH